MEGDDGQVSVQSESNQSTSSIPEMKSPAVPKATKCKRADDNLEAALNPLYEELSKSREIIEKGKGPNEKFAVEVASVLNNIRDEKLVKRTKARIQLILAESMTEAARRDLADSELYSNSLSPLYERSHLWSDNQGPLPPMQPVRQEFSPNQQMGQHDTQSQDLFTQYSLDDN